ncbi:MAG TPA: LysM domain-containing protein [Candidatus Limnocylindrales bacterium]|nr:LysM domain-containing protein [Candidatus Limnocylindrales bacterium]
MTGSSGSGRVIPDARTASSRPTICPFLRSDDAQAGLTFPIETADTSNVCIALGEPLPQSFRQQELVCLSAAHASCPRYLRGVLVAPDATPRPSRRLVSPAIAASIAVLVVSALVSVGYVAAAGGLAVPIASASPATTSAPTASAAVTTLRPDASVGPGVVVQGPTPEPAIEPTPAISPTATPTATPAPTATASPTPAPTPEPTAAGTAASDRFALLVACPGRPDCYVYVVRAGDNLYSIAHYFGVPLDAVYRLNPWTRTTRLTAGKELILPTPTR